MRNKLSLKTEKGRGQTTPTTSVIMSHKSPRLYSGSKNLDEHTTKNIEVGCYPFLYNHFMNNRLVYRRLPRGGKPDDAFKTRLGPRATRLTKDNYQIMKKGQKIYMDRDSVFFRGPFIFQRYSRGPLLNFSAKDVGYDNIYNFTMRPSDLEDSNFILYIVNQKLGQTLKKKKRKNNHTVKRTKKHKKKKKGKKKKGEKTRRKYKRRKH